MLSTILTFSRFCCWSFLIGHTVVLVTANNIFSLNDSSPISRSSVPALVRSMARIVVPDLDDLSSSVVDDEFDDYKDLSSSATKLWNNAIYDDPNDGHFSQGHIVDGPSSLQLHLQGDHCQRKFAPTLFSNQQQDLKLYCKTTGTTIAGCVVSNKEGPYVLLAADTRATDQTMVADKACSKIHPLASNCWCCGAGTSGDLDKVTRQVLYSMALQQMQSSSVGNGDVIVESEDPTIESSTSSSLFHSTQMLYQQGYSDDADTFSNAADDDNDRGEPLIPLLPASVPVLCHLFQEKLFRNQGNLGVNLIMGGVWKGRAYLRAIHPHGSMDVGLPFAALGSGGLAAMAVLEEGYRTDLTLEEGIQLVQKAILSGIRNDLGSGSQVDMCIISPDGTSRHTRSVVPEEELEELVFERRDSGETATDNVRKQDNTPSVGVNGFGNMPFAVEATWQRVVSVETDEARRKAKWDEALSR